MESSEIDAIIKQYGGKESAILAILQDIQAKEKYLPREIVGVCCPEDAHPYK